MSVRKGTAQEKLAAPPRPPLFPPHCLASRQAEFDIDLARDGLLVAAMVGGLMLSAPAAAQLSRHCPALRLVGAGLRCAPHLRPSCVLPLARWA